MWIWIFHFDIISWKTIFHMCDFPLFFSLAQSNAEEEHMNGHEESITVRPEECVNRPCNETCDAVECELCWQCLDNNEKHDLHLAYREIKHRGSMRRVFPPSRVSFYLYSFFSSLTFLWVFHVRVCVCALGVHTMSFFRLIFSDTFRTTWIIWEKDTLKIYHRQIGNIHSGLWKCAKKTRPSAEREWVLTSGIKRSSTAQRMSEQKATQEDETREK